MREEGHAGTGKGQTMTLAKIGDGLSRPERETIIRTSDGDDGWEIYTASPVMARRLAKLCETLGIPLEPVGHWGYGRICPTAPSNSLNPVRLATQNGNDGPHA